MNSVSGTGEKQEIVVASLLPEWEIVIRMRFDQTTSGVGMFSGAQVCLCD